MQGIQGFFPALAAVFLCVGSFPQVSSGPGAPAERHGAARRTVRRDSGVPAHHQPQGETRHGKNAGPGVPRKVKKDKRSNHSRTGHNDTSRRRVDCGISNATTSVPPDTARNTMKRRPRRLHANHLHISDFSEEEIKNIHMKTYPSSFAVLDKRKYFLGKVEMDESGRQYMVGGGNQGLNMSQHMILDVALGLFEGMENDLKPKIVNLLELLDESREHHHQISDAAVAVEEHDALHHVLSHLHARAADFSLLQDRQHFHGRAVQEQARLLDTGHVLAAELRHLHPSSLHQEDVADLNKLGEALSVLGARLSTDESSEFRGCTDLSSPDVASELPMSASGEPGDELDLGDLGESIQSAKRTKDVADHLFVLAELCAHDIPAHLLNQPRTLDPLESFLMKDHDIVEVEQVLQAFQDPTVTVEHIAESTDRRATLFLRLHSLCAALEAQEENLKTISREIEDAVQILIFGI